MGARASRDEVQRLHRGLQNWGIAEYWNSGCANVTRCALRARYQLRPPHWSHCDSAQLAQQTRKPRRRVRAESVVILYNECGIRLSSERELLSQQRGSLSSWSLPYVSTWLATYLRFATLPFAGARTVGRRGRHLDSCVLLAVRLPSVSEFSVRPGACVCQWQLQSHTTDLSAG